MQLSQWCMNSQESGFTGVPWPSHPAVCISVKSRIIGWYISQCTENYSWFYLVYLFIPVYNSPIVLTVLTRFWVGVSSLSGLFRVERKRRRLRGTRSTPEYMCFCVLPMETVCAAVLFLSRSSNVLPIGSANPDFFSHFQHSDHMITYYLCWITWTIKIWVNIIYIALLVSRVKSVRVSKASNAPVVSLFLTCTMLVCNCWVLL